MARVGNRPDCAYFLLIGLCISAFFLLMGGVLTYAAFTQNNIGHHHHHHHHHHHYHFHGANNEENNTSGQEEGIKEESSGIKSHLVNTNKNSSFTEKNIAKFTTGRGDITVTLLILGPFCLVVGLVGLIVIGVLALKYDCDHEPETDLASIKRLTSEMSLNLDPSKNSYELLVPIKTQAQSSSKGLRNEKKTGSNDNENFPGCHTDQGQSNV